MLIDIGERRVMLTSSDDWATVSVEHRGEATTVTWASGHVSTFDADFLSLMDAKANRRRWSPRLWDASHAVAEIDHDTFMADEGARIEDGLVGGPLRAAVDDEVGHALLGDAAVAHQHDSLVRRLARLVRRVSHRA